MMDEFPNFKASKLRGNESSHSWSADFHYDRSPSLLQVFLLDLSLPYADTKHGIHWKGQSSTVN